MSEKCLTRVELDKLFPPERTDEFFDALYGGAEEGAYDIRLACRNITDDKANLAFQLVRREGKCLLCSLTDGLPEVFKRHNIINAAGIAAEVAKMLGWQNGANWSIGEKMDINEDLQMIPFVVERK